MKTHYQNSYDPAKAVLRGNFIVLNAYVKKEPKVSYIVFTQGN